MHEAFNAARASKIEPQVGSVTAIASLSNSIVLLGNSVGQVFAIDKTASASVSASSSSNKDAVITLPKRPVNQLLPIPSLDLLLVLTDGNVHSYSIATFQEREPLAVPAKANLLAAHFPPDDDDEFHIHYYGSNNNTQQEQLDNSVLQDSDTNIVTLAVASRRTLWIGTWKSGGWVGSREVNLPHQVRSLAFVRPSPLPTSSSSSIASSSRKSPSSSTPKSKSKAKSKLPATVSSTYKPLSIFLGFSTAEFGIVSLSDVNHPTLSQLFLPTLSPSSSSISTTQLYPQNTTTPITTTSASIASTNSNLIHESPSKEISSSSFGGFRGLSSLVRLGGPSKVAKNSVISVADSEVVIMRETQGIFLTSEGRPSRNRSIDFPIVPEETVIKGPFIISLLIPPPSKVSSGRRRSITTESPHNTSSSPSKSKLRPNVDSFTTPQPSSSSQNLLPSKPCLYIHSLATLNLIQIIELDEDDIETSTIATTDTSTSVNNNINNVRAQLLTVNHRSNHDPILLIVNSSMSTTSTNESIWTISLIDGQEQFEKIIASGDCDEGISLIDIPNILHFTDPAQKRRLLQTLKNVQLINSHKDFDNAIDNFNDLDINPAKVISLFPKEISGNLYVPPSKREEIFGGRSRESLKQALNQSQNDTKTPQTSSPSSSPSPTQAGAGKDESIPDDSSAESNESSEGDDESSSDDGTESSEEEGEGEDTQDDQDSDADEEEDQDDSEGFDIDAQIRNDQKQYRQFIDTLIRYLTDQRQKVNKAISNLAPNVRPSTSCPPTLPSPSELRSLPDSPIAKLTDVEHIAAIAQVVDTTLFKSYLAIRPGMLGPLCRLENWCQVHQVEKLLLNAKKYPELLDLYKGKQFHEKSLQLLKRMANDEEDLHDKVEPVVSYLHNLGPDNLDLIFETSKWVYSVCPDALISIFVSDEEKVESLPRHAVAKHLEKLDLSVCASFLEHNINVLGEQAPEFHENLIEIYLHLSPNASGGGGGSGNKEENDGDMKQEDEYYKKLLLFLESSHQYRPNRLLGSPWAASLPEVRAILLGRLGQHEEALQIYVTKLHNHLKAEEYCKRVYQSDQSQGSRALFYLIRIYLEPKQSKMEVQLDQALSVLSRHASKMDLVDLGPVLELLPSSVSIGQVSQFITKSIRVKVQGRRQTRLQKEVYQSRINNLDQKLFKLKSQSVTITETRTCPQCHKRLGNSVIALHPDGSEPTHYHCRLAYIESKRSSNID